MTQENTLAAAIAQLLPAMAVEDTSAIVCNLPRLQSRLAHLRACFAADTRHAIAIKTNPHPKLLKFLVAQGFGLEAASIEELRLALDAGCPSEALVFDSPVKTRTEIAEVGKLPGALVNANSLQELARFAEIFPSPDTFKAVLGLRVNPQVHTGGPQLFDVSKNESKFGVPIADRDQIIPAAIASGVRALHMHSGSQMQDLSVQEDALGQLKALADDINGVQPGTIKTLDIGGGLPSEPLGSETVMHRYAGAVAGVLRDSGYQLTTEFGQWVHAEAGFAVSRIEYVLPSGTVFIHLGADFFMRDAYTGARDFPISIWSRNALEKRTGRRSYDIAGPLCFAGDYLARSIPLPDDISDEDFMMIDHTGANTYGLWSRHCSRNVPVVWAWDGQKLVKWSERHAIGF